MTAKTNVPTAEAVRHVSEVLVTPELLSTPDEWADFDHYYHLDDQDRDLGPLRAHALATMWLGSGAASHDGLSRKGKTLLDASSHQVIASLWELWCKQDEHDELAFITTLKGQSSSEFRRRKTSPSWRRQKLIEQLREIEQGVWVEVDDLLAQMDATGSSIAVVDEYGAWALYVDDDEHGSLGYDYQNHRLLVPAYTRAFLFGCAASLGLIDVAYTSPDLRNTSPDWWADKVPYLSPYDGLHAIRITPLGAWVLGKTKTYEAHTPELEVCVLANGHIIAPDVVGTPSASLLDLYASAQEPPVWHLDQESLLAALEAGHDLERLRSFLSTHHSGELPKPITDLLDDVARRASAVKLQAEAVIFRVSTQKIAQEIARDPRTAPLCTLMGKRDLVVEQPNIAKFRAALRTTGYVAGLN